MKILLTGGGTGGHVYPLIAVAEKIREIADEEKLLDVKVYFMSNSPYDKQALFENDIEYVYVPAGKLRIYPSIQNFFDLFKTASGVVTALLKMFIIYPDVVFSKGGYASFPALFAAKILRIPVIIHESDSAPGRVSVWSSRFAKRIAVSFPEAAEFFPKEKVAWTGQPMRSSILSKAKEGAFDYFNFSARVKTIFILGGSQGSVLLNDAIITILPELLNTYQVIHQIGKLNIKEVTDRTNVILHNHPNKNNYKGIAFLNPLEMKMASGCASLVISRAGSTIFEIASWGIPSILVPFEKSNADHAKKNAYNYARAGAATVLEENNITETVFLHAINEILNNEEKYQNMSLNAARFCRKDAAAIIANELLTIAKSHQ